MSRQPSAERAQPLGDLIGLRHARVAEDLDCRAIVQANSGTMNSALYMISKVRRYVTHPQAAIRRAIVAMRVNVGASAATRNARSSGDAPRKSPPHSSRA